ncbi:amidohydrolase [Pandoraea communis]|uniref:Amidohydrolase n=3 Tax=Pandoraea communis TaxID=2508297 RepID=A0A5E4Z662_9BURK|nr:amidohydrolase [Pandoraea communis]
MLEKGVKVGAGTDATRVASYNPWVSLYWLTTGKTVGGLRMSAPGNLLDRNDALRLWTEANTWFSSEVGKKGQIKVGQLADLAVLSADYFSVPEDEIQDITSVLTLLGGKVVYGDGDFGGYAPEIPPAMPDWSPARHGVGYKPRQPQVLNVNASCVCATSCGVHGHAHTRAWMSSVPASDESGFWGALGCSCWAF